MTLTRNAFLRATPMLALLFLLAGCLGAQPSEKSRKTNADVVAMVDGQALTQADLEEFLSDQLSQLELQKAKLLEEGLGPFVEQTLLELGAKNKGLSLDDYVSAEVAERSTEVTDSDVDQWYEANQSRLRGQTKEQIGPQIRDFLTQTQAAEIRSTLVGELRKEYDVEILLDPVRVDLEGEGGVVKGGENAPVTIVEFSDFECPACKGFNPTITQLLDKYGDDIQVVFRHLPLRSIHPRAQKAAEASMCARDQGKFWELHDTMFAQQRNLSVDGLKSMAAENGLEPDAFAKCLDSGQYADAVESEVRMATRLGLNGTPSVFINGRIIAPGRVPSFGAMVTMIDEELLRNSGK